MRYFSFLIICFSIASSQSLYTNPPVIAFDTTLTSTQDSLSLWIVNKTSSGVSVYDINLTADQFSVRDTSFFLQSNDSVRTWIRFSSVHNLSYSGYAFIETNLKSGSIVVPLSGTKKYSESMYAATQGKSGEALKTALTAITKIGQITLGYNTGRDRMFMEIDNKKVNGQSATVNTLECVYTGRLVTNYTDRTNAQTSGSFNTEHTWPQSKFNSVDPMVSDLFHLFPTDEAANSKRSNYPFGVVVSSTWNVGGSKYGNGLGGQIVFEPRDEHKGDCARSMLYFVTRYGNLGTFWAESPYQELAFRDWNKRFPPTPKSIARNNGVQTYQGNRNPFIDHPEFVDRINNFLGTATVTSSARLVASPANLDFGGIFSVSDPNKKLILANAGDKALSITSIIISNSAFTLTDTITFLQPNGYRIVNVRINGNDSGSISSGTLTMNYTDGSAKQLSIGLSGYIVTKIQKEDMNPAGFALQQNYPNPFNLSMTVGFTVPVVSFVTVKVYDVLGKEIATLVSEVLEPGEYRVPFYAVSLPSGIYYYRLSAGSYSETKKMILQK